MARYERLLGIYPGAEILHPTAEELRPIVKELSKVSKRRYNTTKQKVGVTPAIRGIETRGGFHTSEQIENFSLPVLREEYRKLEGFLTRETSTVSGYKQYLRNNLGAILDPNGELTERQTTIRVNRFIQRIGMDVINDALSVVDAIRETNQGSQGFVVGSGFMIQNIIEMVSQGAETEDMVGNNLELYASAARLNIRDTGGNIVIPRMIDGEIMYPPRREDGSYNYEAARENWQSAVSLSQQM